MKKAIVSGIILAVLFVLTFIPASALAGDEDWSYKDDGFGRLVVTKYNGTDTIVTIPDTLGGRNVSIMGDDLFTHGDGSTPTVTKVIIPACVESIEDGAFWECRQLESIDVAADNSTYKSVNGIVFSKDGRTLIHYPAGKAGTSYSIPADVTTIGSSAFDHAKNLESITITDNVSSINRLPSGDATLLRALQYRRMLHTLEKACLRTVRRCPRLQSIY